jgi:2-amino-4-hydroxy-6-hydroxymethyldihydropteridine diphosphokinase
MARAYLIIGSNQGDRLQMLERAHDTIHQEIGSVLNQSSIYETAPWGFDHPTRFLNQVLEIETLLDSENLLGRLLDIEKKLGRTRSGRRYSPRLIDIDLLFYDDSIINTKTLVVPHPKLADRRFVLIPLCELVPSFRHPVLNITLEQLLTQCKDTSDVRIFRS